MYSLIVRTTNQIHWFIKMLCSIALQDKKYAFAENHFPCCWFYQPMTLCEEMQQRERRETFERARLRIKKQLMYLQIYS